MRGVGGKRGLMRCHIKLKKRINLILFFLPDEYL